MKNSRRRNPINLGASGVLSLVAIVGIGAAGYYIYKNRAAIKTAFNPMSDKNLAYQGANAALAWATGNKVDSVGTAAANVFKSSAEKAVDAMLNPPKQVYVAPDMTQGSYYDMGKKAPVVSTSDGSFSSWLSSQFQSPAEKEVNAQYANGLGEVPRRMRYAARVYRR